MNDGYGRAIYTREFNSDKVIKATTNVYPLSKYFPYPMKDGLFKSLGNKGYIRLTDYILGPIYDTKEFQIGVTGSVEINEEPIHAIARELGEEIGIVPKNSKSTRLIKEYTWKRLNKCDVQFHIYDAYIKDCIPVLEHQNQALLSKDKDRKDSKVGCFIFGNKKAVLDFLGSKKIYYYKSGDGIIGVGAIRVKDI
jgi:hypothetical protein